VAEKPSILIVFPWGMFGSSNDVCHYDDIAAGINHGHHRLHGMLPLPRI